MRVDSSSLYILQERRSAFRLRVVDTRNQPLEARRLALPALPLDLIEQRSAQIPAIRPSAAKAASIQYQPQANLSTQHGRGLVQGWRSGGLPDKMQCLNHFPDAWSYHVCDWIMRQPPWPFCPPQLPLDARPRLCHHEEAEDFGEAASLCDQLLVGLRQSKSPSGLDLRLICSAVCLMRFMVGCPYQPGRLRILIDPGQLAGGAHATWVSPRLRGA